MLNEFRKIWYTIYDRLDIVSTVGPFIKENNLKFYMSSGIHNGEIKFIWQVEMTSGDASYLMLTNSGITISKCKAHYG